MLNDRVGVYYFVATELTFYYVEPFQALYVLSILLRNPAIALYQRFAILLPLFSILVL